MNKKQYEIYIQYKFQCNLGVLNEMCHLESYTWWLKDQYWDTNLPVQYGLSMKHSHLALKCRFLEFEANSNAA